MADNFLYENRLYQGIGIVDKVPPSASNKCRIEAYYLLSPASSKRTVEQTKLFFYSDSLCDLIPGDTIIFKGTFENIELRGFHGEGFISYLINNGVHHQLFPKSLYVTKCIDPDFETYLGYIKRLEWVEKIKQLIPGQEGDFLVSLCLGYRIVAKEVKTDFQIAGAMHILAISGLHIGLAGSVVSWILGRFLGNNLKSRLIKSGITQLSIWSFVIISGISEPAVRAAIMLAVWDLGRMWDRKAHWSQLLSLSAIIQLLLDANNIYKPGFQLSYLAVASILLTSKWIQLAVRLSPTWGKWLTALILVSFAAQAGVAGIGALHFGQFPILFILSNLIAMPAATILLITGWVLLGCIYLFPDIITNYLAWIIEQFIDLLIKSISLISAMTPDSFLRIHVTDITVLLYYLLICTLICWLFWRKKGYLFLALILFASLRFSVRSDTLNTVKKTSFTIWNTEAGLMLSSHNGSNHEIFTCNELKIPYDARKQIRHHRSPEHAVSLSGPVVFNKADNGAIMYINAFDKDSIPIPDNCTAIFGSADMPGFLISELCKFKKIVCANKDLVFFKNEILRCATPPSLSEIHELAHYCPVTNEFIYD